MPVLSLQVKYRALEKPLNASLKKALFYLKREKRPVEVFLISNDEMRRLNRQFRGKNKPTTVLSFEFDAAIPYPKAIPRPLGEIYLAPDYIRKVKAEPAALLMHGLVHLLGYTHEKTRDKILMERLERRILSKISHS